ncbi:MAG: O-antigen polymerase [Devosia sp.]
MLRPKLLIQLTCILLVTLAIVFGMLGLSMSSDAQLYLAFACLAGAIPLAATLADHRDTDPFSPISFIAISVLFGTTATSFWLTSANTARANDMMFGQTFAEVTNGQYWVIIGLICLCAGYILVVPKVRINVQPRPLSATRVRLVLIALLAISVFGTLLFIVSFGIDFSDLAAQSVKRSSRYVDQGGDIVYGTGFEIFLAKLSGVGLIFAGGLMISERRRTEYALYAAVFLALTTLVGFISSSRTSIVYTIASVLICAYYYKRVSWRAIFLVSVLTVSVVAGLGVLRAQNSNNTGQYETIADLVLGTGNGFDAVRTSALIARVPERHDFLYGSSYLSLLTGMIPRSVWPDKPSISLGPWVKSELYGLRTQNNGWPPGMVAEAYFNFGYTGIPLVMFLFGAGLRLLYAFVRPYLGVSPIVTMSYSIGMFGLAYNSFSLNFSLGILQAVQYTWPFLLIGLVIYSSTRTSQRAIVR